MSNYDYVNGVIAVKEGSFITDKILRATELSPEDAFKSIVESTETQALGAGDYKKLIQEREEDILSFVNQYLKKDGERAFFMLGYDYDNLKAIIKAKAVGEETGAFIGKDGVYSAAQLVKGYGDKTLPKFMQECVNEIDSVENPSGADIGLTVNKYYYKDLLKRVKSKSAREIIKERATLINLITTLKLGSYEKAQPYYINAGVKQEFFKEIGKVNLEKKNPLEKYGDIVFAYKKFGVGEAERLADVRQISYLSDRKYVLSSEQPLMWYVLRKKIENKNLGILFSCLLKGMSGDEIKQRLRFW